MARPVLTHRMALSFAARARGESLAGISERTVGRTLGREGAAGGNPDPERDEVTEASRRLARGGENANRGFTITRDESCDDFGDHRRLAGTGGSDNAEQATSRSGRDGRALGIVQFESCH